MHICSGSRATPFRTVMRGCEVVDLQQTTIELVSREETEKLVSSARAWLADEAVQEADLAWMFGFCFENGLGRVIALAPEFVRRYPESLFPVRVFFADLLIQNNLFDQASHEARAYLRRVKNAGIFDKLDGEGLLVDGIARAFLQLTSVYTEAGARTYSHRVLEYGQSLNLSSRWKEAFTSEMRRLDHEFRADAATAALDDVWEGCFTTGRGMDDVLALCAKRNFPMLSKRVELICDKLRFDIGFQVDRSEMFMIIHKDEREHLLLL